MSFKKGDLVKVVKNAYGLTMGCVYAVEKDTPANDRLTYVRRDNGTIDGWNNDRFELVKPANETGTFIIIGEFLGGLTPATEPRKYTSMSQAKAVAHALATKSPGEKFVIFKAVGEAVADKPKSVVSLY